MVQWCSAWSSTGNTELHLTDSFQALVKAPVVANINGFDEDDDAKAAAASEAQAEVNIAHINFIRHKSALRDYGGFGGFGDFSGISLKYRSKLTSDEIFVV